MVNKAELHYVPHNVVAFWQRPEGTP